MKRFIIQAMQFTIMLLLLPLIGCGEHEFGQPQENTDTEILTPPGVVITHYKRSSRIYPSSPSICILENGDYLAAVELGGPGCPSPKQTDIYKSTDKGETWSKHSSVIGGQAWSNIFTYKGDVYIMGVAAPGVNCVIRKSEDGGATWTQQVTQDNGLLLTGGCHTAPVPFVESNGRVWRAMEGVNPQIKAWPKQYNARMMSAPADADLMKASSWTTSNELIFNSEYLDGYFGGWLEGNAVATPEGKVKLVMRVELPQSNTEKIALIDVSDDGTQLSFEPETGFVEMPGGAKKFTIRYDPQSSRYWTLSNYVEQKYFHMTPGLVRNVLTLCSSEDLRRWTAHKVILSYPEVKYHAFQYVDWLTEGNDIVFVSRTAYDDNFGGADSHHNANYTTFHRIEDFRTLVSQTIEE